MQWVTWRCLWRKSPVSNNPILVIQRYVIRVITLVPSVSRCLAMSFNSSLWSMLRFDTAFVIPLLTTSTSFQVPSCRQCENVDKQLYVYFYLQCFLILFVILIELVNVILSWIGVIIFLWAESSVRCHDGSGQSLWIGSIWKILYLWKSFCIKEQNQRSRSSLVQW